MKHLNITFFLSCLILSYTIGFTSLQAQWIPSPGKAQEKTILITGGTIHVGNGQIIEDGLISFSNGKIELVQATQKQSLGEDIEIIDATGKHIYPGLISPNTANGLIEIEAVRATRDNYEIGKFKPHLRPIIAYNADSWVTPTLRSNGILISQIVARGGTIPGSSDIVQLDAWNYEDALVKGDEGITLNFPNIVNRGGWWAEPGDIKSNDKYQKQMLALKNFFLEAKAYCQNDRHEIKNLKFEAMCKVFKKEKKVYISASHAKNILNAIEFIKEFDIDGVIVGGRDAWLVTDELKENNIPVILRKPHSLPYLAHEDVDLSYKLPFLLEKAGVNYCIQAQTGSGEQRNLPFTAGKAVAYGLTKEKALMAITSNAAKIMGIDDRLGTIETGKDATLVISTGDILDPQTNHIELAFVEGRKVNLDNKQKDLYRKFMDKYDLKHKRH